MRIEIHSELAMVSLGITGWDSFTTMIYFHPKTKSFLLCATFDKNQFAQVGY